MRDILGAVLLVALFSGPVAAEERSQIDRSDFWLQVCSESDAGFGSGACLGFITGYKDSLYLAKFYVGDAERNKRLPEEQLEGARSIQIVTERSMLGCGTQEVTIGQMQKVWVKYLKENPQQHHFLPGLTLAMALRKAFPCN